LENLETENAKFVSSATNLLEWKEKENQVAQKEFKRRTGGSQKKKGSERKRETKIACKEGKQGAKE